MQRTPQRIQFIHIPKCAGMSINKALAETFGKERTVLFFGQNEGKSIWHAYPKESHWEHELRFLEFKRIILQSYFLSGHKFIGGHLPFSDLTYDYFHKETIFLTVIREPVQRTCSALKYFLAHQDPGFKQLVNKEPRQAVDKLEAWISNDSLMKVLANQMTLFLGGSSCHGLFSEEQLLSKACAATKRLDHIGLFENLKSFFEYIEKLLGIVIEVPHENAFSQKGFTDEASNAINTWMEENHPRIRQFCIWDEYLYNYTKKSICVC